MSSGAVRRRLLGRRSECESLGRLVANVRAGRSQVLVLRGEAGVGKSALVDYLVGSAAGCRIARAVGVESEMELPFAGLHQLCVPMMGHLDRLPGPQRDALSVAFGLSTGSAPDRFLVGLAVLNLLAEVAEEQPLVCVFDDAQWLDQVSAQTLAFVARRLLAERAALVFAVREPVLAPAHPLTGMPELVVTGLRDGDARALLESAVPGRIDERIRDRIVAETRGNPLALLELPRGLTAAELTGGFGRPDARPLAGQIEQSFLRRIEALPIATQRLLLTAAAEPLGDVSLLRRVAERLAIEPNASVAAEAAGLIEIGVRVRFRHPLVRSAAYRAASAKDRQAVHRALAAATDPESDPDRRAWHRAHGVVEPDESVAGELERSADRAQARGGIAAAAVFLKRSTELTPDPVNRVARALAAAHASFEAGSSDAASELLAAAELGPLGELQRARLARLRARIVLTRRRGRDAVPFLVDAADQLERLGDGQAREAYLESLAAAVFAGRLLGQNGLREVAEAAMAAPPASRPPRPIDMLLDGLVARFTKGYVSGAPLLKRALQAFRQDSRPDEDDFIRWFWLAWFVAGDMWDDETSHELTTRAVRLAREAGALNVLPLALTHRAAVHLHAGEFAAASELVEECDALTEATGHAPMGYSKLSLAAWRGEAGVAPVPFQSDVQDGISWGEGRAIGGVEYVRAVLYNGLGRYQEALACAKRGCEFEDLGVFGFTLVELVEAGVRGGALEVAGAAMRRLEERTDASGTDWALGARARSAALLADGRSADSLYREAIERLERTRVNVHLARAHLVYGEWLRRENRRVDARAQLRTAYEMLQRFGASGFAERARRELQATGETVRRRSADVRDVLTAQEAQIARLAGEGMTNSEIGAELFISPRTVEWHLRKVFTKLDVSSRNKLRGALTRA
ncbi:AAA family ATPase [Pseudonocardia sp. DSM 110487]|uniref:helix-turn-helix transcriptional regulator n=1 Tax=Pseudonocardia sp. DSM 110487 TaxID=2865833 RepID=UPI001C69D51F|nr:LuxR family transcriptional regulator [Pseudonocardia sp. DSM 110487]QYN34098.1 AAA family ATPase [Pseudonocardia sp. DSM 110487]